MASAVIAALSLLAADGAGYAWPLDLPPQLTSSFAEYRPGRFHAGVDLRTGGIGQPVRAIADGYVSRVRCSPWGYGKAIYLQLNDGNIVVYGHLDDYDDALRAYVRAEQHRIQDYTVDLYPAAGRFPVQRGQVIAKSGQTGIGAPHLHFELRDGANRPINPRKAGMHWPDTTRPQLRRLAVIPLAPDASVQGDFNPYVVDLVDQGNGHYSAPPIRAHGPVAFGVDLRDPGSGGYNLGVHRLRLLHDGTGQEVFRVQHDRVSYDNHRNGVVAYHPYLKDRGRYLMLWRWPGNTCDLYTHTREDGRFAMGESAASLRIEATDFFENSARLSFTIEAEALPETGDPAAAPGTGRGTVSLDCDGPMLVASVRFTSAEARAPAGTIDGQEALQFRRVDAQTWRAPYVPTRSGMHSVTITHPNLSTYTRQFAGFVRGQGGRVEFDGVTLNVPSDAPYGVLFAQAYPLADPPSVPLRLLSPVWRVWPAETPIDAEVTMAFPAPASVDNWARVHVYRNSGSSWSREDTRREGGKLVITTRRFGTYAILEDATAPLIAEVTPSEGYRAQTRRPHIRATVKDHGSGVSGVRVTCAGKWLLTAYDPERSRIEWERDEDLPSGTQEVEIRITDAAGNTKSATRTVVIP